MGDARGRVAIWVGAGLAAVAAAALGLGVLAREERSLVRGVPESTYILACEKSGAWLAARMQNGPAFVVDGALQPPPRRTDLLRLRPGQPEVIEDVGEEVARTLSTAADGTSWLVVQAPDDEYTGSSRLLVGSGAPGAWREWPSPAALMGAAAESASQGFAWSRQAILRTEDEGRTWKRIATGQLIMAGHGLPRLLGEDQAGGLLVPLVSGHQATGWSELWWIARDGSHTVLGRWEAEEVVGLAIHQGNVVVALQPWIRGDSWIVLAKLERGRLAFKETWRSGTEHVSGLQAAGERVAFLAAGAWGKSGFFGDTPQVLLQSRDGVEWSREDLTGKRIRSVCLAPGRRWMLGGAPLQVSFTPTAR
jgi:hypothetical protein